MAIKSGHHFDDAGFGFTGSKQAGGGAKMRPAMPAPRAGAPTPMPGGRHGGGVSIDFHPDGRVAVHHGTGMSEHMQHYAKGGAVKGGDEAQDKALVKKGIHQHENHEHGGKHTDLKLARGGAVRMPGMKGVKTPRAAPMRKVGSKKQGALTQASALNQPPLDPRETPTEKNVMPGGEMGYGVQPSNEGNAIDSTDDSAGASTGSPMKRGGKVRRMRA